jgi:hypothetical protein
MTVAWLLLALLGRAATADAHAFEPGILDLVERAAGVFDVQWRRPAAAALAPRLPEDCRPLAPRPRASESGRWRVDCGPDGLRGRTLAVDGFEDARADVVVRVRWRDGTATSGIVRRETPALALPVGAAGGAAGVGGRYLRLGVEHILLGPDHLLFVAGLLLLVRGAGRLVGTLTAFTAAHSVTLALAVLGVVAAPPAPVEVLIAGSIVLVALELARPPRPLPSLAVRAPWAVAFLVGLLHGFGFAGALAGLGVPSGHVPLALLAFNAGVELGQLAFVAALLLPVAAYRRAVRALPGLRLVPAYAIGGLAAAWTLDRLPALWSAGP